MRLRVLSRHSSSAGTFAAGQVLEVSDAIGEYLMRDAPGSFAREEEQQVLAESTETLAAGIEAPDRRVRKGLRRSVSRPAGGDNR